ncbi:MAG: non-ribosomal peptide synthase/polyketide synthase, partial [Byssovorax sp.]
LEPERDLGRSPLFQVMFTLQSPTTEAMSLPGLTLAREDVESGTSKFDLTLWMQDNPGDLACWFEYSTDLFDASTIARMEAHLRTLLTALVKAPDCRVRDLSILDAAERRKVLVDWNATAFAYPDDACIHEIFEAQAARAPDAIALVFEDKTLTYRALNARANQLAHALRKRGVGPSVLVGVCMERSIEMVVALYAVLKAGGAYVPFDPEYPKDRLAFMLEDTHVPVVLTQAHLDGVLPEHDAAVIQLDAEWESIAAEPEGNPARDGLSLDTLAYAIYTSGSTGRPKGALNAHRGILNRLQWMQRTYRLDASDRVLQKTPFSFDVSVWELFWPLMFGATLVVAKPEGHKDPAYLAGLIEAQEITTTHFVPSMLKAFLDELPRGRCASLARVFCSGEALPPAMVEAFFAKIAGSELHNLYGPTEAAVDVTYFACHAGDAIVPIGRPVDNTQIYLLDDRMEPVAVGVRGELYIGGVQVGRGYLNRPELTAERFLRDPFSAVPGARLYRTGDVARHLVSGEIEYLGRADFQVKIRGFRIELGEIEAVLAAHPAVRDVTVVAREDAPGQKRLVGYLVCAGGQAPTVGDLRAFLKDRLPEYMVPSAFVLLAAMPLSSSGKVNRRALPAPEDGTRAETGAEFVAPRSAAEEALSRIWAGILRLPKVGIHDNFFELGGDSILSIQVVARALQVGLHLTPRQLFQHQTIAELAAVAGAKSKVIAEQGPITGAAPLTPVQRWWRELAPQDPQHWNQSIFLEAGEPIDAAALEKAASALLDHHDALRLRLSGGEQVFGPPGEPVEIVRINLSALAGAEQTAALEKAAGEVQGSLDLERGPVVRVALFDLGANQPQRLLVVIHHLAVDGISWRILIEDLWTAYTQAARGQAISLPAKTTSARRWAELLAGRAGSPELAHEEAYWTGGASRPATRLPVDRSEGANTEGSARSITVTLTEDETEALLRKVPEAYQTQINDVLLTAFTQAMEAWTGGESALFDLEGHGREDLFEGVDLTRTVGWFTTVYPVLLQLAPGAGPAEALKSVKEQLRAVPENGLGHGLLRYLRADGDTAALLRAAPQAEVSFNYLGQRDLMLPEGAPLRLAFESAGPAASPRAQRRYLLDVLGRVTGGVLSVRWIYSENRHTLATIEALAGRFVAALRALVAHCLSPDAGGYTPSDFRRARLAQPAIDRLVAAEGGKKELEDAYPLSPIQAGILFHTLYDASPEAYVVQLAWTLRGELDIPTFTRAWQAVVDRHPILRTKFEHDNLDEPLQIVKRKVPVAIAQVDISALSPDEQSARIDRYTAEDRRRGFDLAQAPLMRWSLLRLGPDAHRFLWSSHHLLLDGWSTQIVVKQVFALYDAFLGGDEPRLERVAPYGDYVAWIRGQSKAPVEAFWRDRLQGFSAPTPLGVDRPVGPGAGERYGEVRFDVSEADSALLATFARKHKLTVSTLVQGAWALLLSRYSREDDVVFGSTVSGRSAAVPGIDRMVGLFINTLAVRAKIGPTQTTLEWLAQIQEDQSVLREYEHSPLVDVQGYSAVPRGTPLFESLLIFENYPIEESIKRGAKGFSATDPRVVERPPYPLTVVAVFRSALFFRIGFDLARFDEATIARLTGHLHTLLLGMASAPESLVAALPILPAAERHTLITEWNATAMEYPRVGAHHLIEARADARPDAVAVACEGVEITYRELDRRGNQLARYLQRRGAGPGTRIGISTDRSIDMVVAALAVMKSGAAYVPLDPTYPKDRLAFIAADAGLLLLLTQASVADEIEGIGGESIQIDAEWPTVALESAARLDSVSPKAIAYVLYTSGSTGKPKGVRIPHRALVNFLTTMRAEPGFTASDRLLAVTSLSFDIAGLELFLPLIAGGVVEIASRAAVIDGLELADLLVSREITVMQATPSTWRLLLDTGWSGAPITVLVGGEAVPRELVDKLAPRVTSVWNMYGPTETTIWSTLQRLHEGGGPVPIGRPIGNTQAYVLDRLLHPVPIGVAGELHLGGDGVALGYFDRPELTRERFIPSPFLAGATLYKTGDLCRFRGDGALEFLGRTDFQVKLRGYRIELGEIEAVLAQYPSVIEAATTVREDTPGDKRLVAYLIMTRESSLNQADLRAFLGTKLPGYMVPSAYVILPAMPLTPNGKLDRRALPAPGADAQGEAGADFVAPRSEAEEALSRIWAGVLRLPRVGIHDNFFEVGGDSILSIQVVARARHAGLHLTPRQLFQHPTVAELAAVVGAKSTVVAEQGPVTGAAPLTPVQRWWRELAPQDPQHWNQSIFLEALEPIDAAALEKAASALLDHHDALRLRFAGGEQVFAPPGEPAEVVQVNLSALEGAEQTAALEKATGEVQGSLDLERGPVVRVALFDLGKKRPQRLLVVIHHLAVDGVSWRILLEDLWTAYTQVSDGKAISLPAKTTSAKRWAELLAGRARSPEAAREDAYWTGRASLTSARLPVDHLTGANTEGSARSVTVTLTEEETEALLRRVPEAYQTQINDVLLTAFTQAMEAWTGSDSALFDLEGHGREDLFEGVDLTRTVGWFTTVYPVLLHVDSTAGLAESLKSVKEQLRSIPGNGLGHGLLRYLREEGSAAAFLQGAPQAEVSFNYLGQRDQMLPEGAPLRLATESAGPSASPRAQRRYLLDVLGRVTGGVLSVRWIYSENRHTPATIEALAGRFVAALRALVAHCLSPDAGGYTPSDFRRASLAQPVIDRLVAAEGGKKELEDAYPLSPIQAGILFHSLYDASPETYVVQIAWTLRGEVDVPTFTRAWQAVVDRHPILRTRFEQDRLEEPLQLVRRRVPVAIAQVDISALSPGEQAERIDRYCTEDRRKGFNPAQAPLMRWSLLRLAPDAQRFIWSSHHLLLDGWSTQLVLKEAFAAYDALLGGDGPRLERVVPYGEYIGWIRRQSQAPAEAFWRERLEGFSAPTPLGVDRPGGPGAGERYGELRFDVPEADSALLAAFARKHKLTVSTLVQGAWALLLSRYSREDDVVFGATVSGRSAGVPGIDRMVGLFINTLPVRVTIGPEQTTRAFLSRLQDEQSLLREHEHSPLVDVQGYSAVPRGTPLFESLLVFENYPLEESIKRGAKGFSATDPRVVERPPYPLTVIAVFRSTLFFRFGFDLARFDHATIARMTGHLHTLLLGLASSPSGLVAELPILTAEERSARLTAWKSVEFPVVSTIHERFEAQVERTPDALAVTFEGQSLTYREVDERSSRLAHHLRKLGVGREVLTGICVQRSLSMVIAVLGVLKAGGAYLPLDPEYPKDRLAFMIEDAQIPVLVTEAEHAAALPEHSARVVRLDADADEIALEPSSRLAGAASPADLAYVIYTSGSTGKPKGAMVTHANVVRLFDATDAWYHFDGSDVWTLFHSYAFDFSVWEIWGALLYGGRLVVVPYWVSRAPEAFYKLLGEEGVTVLNQTPSAFRQLAAADEVATPEARAALCLRYVIFGGEALDLADLRGFWDRHGDQRPQLVNMYGITETTVHVTYRPVSRADLERPSSSVIGCPIPDLEVYIVDKRGGLVPIGVPGEMLVGGAGVSRGYLRRPELSAARFFPDTLGSRPGGRLYKTGDLARYQANGDIDYLGRIDHQVKIRGFRIELGEIEAALDAHPEVREAVVLAREDTPGDRRLVAYLVVRGEKAPPASALRAFLELQLPAYMVPAAFVTLPEFPLSATGKLDRGALPAPEGHALSERAYTAPRGPVEESLAGIFAEVLHLGAGSVGAHDGFFELGGHSLLATQAMSRLRAAFGVELPLRSIFDAPTPAELAHLVEGALIPGQRAALGASAPPLVRAGDGRATALSFAQERLWFLAQLDPGDPAYLVLLGMRLEGRLDRAALGRALAEIMRRHEVLRTTFASVDGKPHAVIHADFTLDLPETDLRALARQDRDEAVRQASVDEAARPFDLGQGPLIRARLLAFGDDDHALFLSMHHVVADDWTLAVLMREIGALYTAFHAGEASPLVDLAVQYADYAVWQRRWLEGPALDEQLGYWTRHLEGAPRILSLPTDRPRPPVRSSRGARARFELGRELTDKLTELSRREGATLFMTLHAAFDVLLYRYTGQSDIVVGSPIANRTRAETEGLLGLFINTMVLRVEVAPELSFKDLIARVREVCLGAYAHQDTPFERLVQRLDPERDPGRSPLFQVIFNLQNAPGGGLELPDLRLSSIRIDNPTVKTDLVLIMNEGPQGLRGSFYYSAELFDAATIERLITHYLTLLEGVVSTPAAKIADLPLLPEAELRRVLSGCNDTFVRYAGEATVHGLFEERALRTPDALALVAGAARLSYRELDRRANQIANHLRKLGVGPDSVVGLSLDRTAGMIEALLGILKAGGAYVPLDPGYPAPRLAQILEEASCRVVVTEERFAANLPDGVARVRLDADAAAIVGESDARPASVSGAANLVYVLFTSGSTGKPKGVAIEHRQLVNYVRGVAERLDLPTTASYAHVSTFSADLGNTVLFPPLCLGGTLHVIAQEMTTDPDQLGACFAREEIDCLKIVPSHLSALLSGAHPERVLPRKLLVLGGEGSSWELIARVEKLAPALRIMNHYGPTETTVGVLTYPVEKGQTVPGTAIVPLGRPLPNSRVYVLDAQQRPTPIGVHGEAYIGGSGVARGYLGRPDLTAERFLPDPFAAEPGGRMYRTGDRVRRLADGTLVFLGRVDFQVKIRGFRIELGEIEASLASHPALHDVVVLALDDAQGGSGNKHLAAFVVARSGEAAEPAALAAFVAARLPEYMVPASITVLPALPLTPNGKIDRQALAALDRPATPAEAATSAPRNPTEEVLASIWEDVFGKEQIGIDESFADLGGHSLLAIQIIARARDAFQAEISLRAIFEKPTIRGLAGVIDESVREGFGLLVPAIVAVPRGAGMELSFSQERLWFLDQLEPGSSFYNVPVGWRLQGRLDTGALERAVREVVRRHEVLRTTFTTVNGRPSQVIHEGVSIRLPVADLGALAPEAREEAAKQEALAEANRPFDLARGPLLRVKLLRLAPEDHVLLLTLHHIVSDAWTRGILNTEIGTLYEAFREGRPALLAELPIQYADYAHWQRRWLDGEVLDKQLDYWKTALDGAPRVLELPADRPRPPVSTHQGAHLGFTLPPELSAGLLALSRREGTTLFMTLLSAFSVLLHRTTGQTDILIGTPVANRAKSELESLIGFFINTLVMRAQMTDDLPFVELLARIREVAISGYAHQDMPFESLVQQLSPDRDLGRTPLFQVLFQLQAAPIEAMTLP